MELSQEVHDAGQEIAAATEGTVADTLNRVLGRFIGWPFEATPGYASDRDGNRTALFASVVRTASNADSIPADAVAAVIDVCDVLDLDGLRTAYRRIAQAKTLKKSRPPDLGDVPHTTMTLGIVLALRAALPLEDFAEELERLNTQTPSQQWPDMIVIVSTGAIHYAVQFPGEQISGDFLPPGDGALAAYTPPLYIITVMRPTGAYTFNKMLAYLVAHLALFSPGARLPEWAPMLEGMPHHVVTFSGFQYNLRGDLVPVPRELYNDRYIPPLPMRIENRQSTLLATMRFLPWQDGGAILLNGKLPLAGFLLFLDPENRERAGVVQRPGSDAQISYVLPITQAHFAELLMRIQQRSNMVVRRETASAVVQKFADEGTRSPFMARMLIGTLRLRDVVFPDLTARLRFDKPHQFVALSLIAARTTAQEISRLWADHIRKVTAGEIARVQGLTIHVDQTIDTELRRQVESFLNSAARILKQGMQTLARELQVDIGFLFQQQAAFEKGLAALQSNDAPLVEYLRHARAWSERLQTNRIALEHDGWILPQVTYSHTAGRVQPTAPPISGQPVTDFVPFVFDRSACFVEEVTTHCLQRQMPTGITVTEIPRARRVEEMPERFRITVTNGGMPAWQIAFHASSFDET
jgi:hypothetical protein